MWIPPSPHCDVSLWWCSWIKDVFNIFTEDRMRKRIKRYLRAAEPTSCRQTHTCSMAQTQTWTQLRLLCVDSSVCSRKSAQSMKPVCETNAPWSSPHPLYLPPPSCDCLCVHRPQCPPQDTTMCVSVIWGRFLLMETRNQKWCWNKYSNRFLEITLI